ncbi:peptidoglycan-binding protein [Streptomyces sp. NPDC088354]|uniref:peptidoglycan-binding protein n=1 Tax=Streptomyces sp. NPDC088354 TaxID=3365856 RepID=UPI0038288D21
MSPLRGRGGPANRGRSVGLIVGVVTLVGAGGWFAGSQMQSPADAAAAHQAPKAGPVTVAVVRQKLTARVVTQGSVEFGAPHAVSLSGPVGSPDDSGDGQATAQLVTKLPTEGATLREGSVLMQVSGRPVFVLRGPVPMYRTLGPGMSGDDVRQLQSALRRLGHDPGAVSGNYRQGTATAVDHWYESAGYTPRKPSAADASQLGDLQAAVSQAQLALLSARNGGATAGGGDDGGGATGTASGAGSGSGSGSDDAAHALELRSAQQQLNRANAALSAFDAGYGTKVPAGEVVFLPDLPVRVDKVKARLGAAPDGEVATVTSADVVVQAVVPGTDGAVLREGMVARIETGDGTHVNGVVSQLGGSGVPADGSKDEAGEGGEADGGDGGSGAPDVPADSSAPVPVVISIPDPGPLRNQSGLSAKVTVDVGASKGAVLVVPVVAVRTSADGQARVAVARAGKVVDVRVTVGLSAAGLVAVTPEDAGSLAEGDHVVVGT